MATTYNSYQQWEAIIGLEVHVQLRTLSKLFSGASTAYGAAPNTQICALDIALPGTLPVLNQEAVCMAIKFGLSIQATIAKQAVFARKNYFYPDLPKGYQISQHNHPIVEKGCLLIELENGRSKAIGITRAHLEEDAGKSLHEGLALMSGIDFNRAGVPLLEVVSEPDLRSEKEAVAYLKALHRQVCYLQICDGNLQEGSFRVDANVSVRPKGTTTLGTRVEIKNLNSFRFVEKSINYEIERQIGILEQNGPLQQETRLYNADKNETRTMRSKEDVGDYRYFSDPDLCPLTISPAFIAEIQAKLPELPQQKLARFQQQYGLTAYDAGLLVSTWELADYFETVVKNRVPAKLAANWINGELAAAINKAHADIRTAPIQAARLAGLLQRLADNTVSGKMAKTIFEMLWDTSATADEIIAQQGLRQVTDATAIEKTIREVLVAYPQQLTDYRSGKESLFGFFFGKIIQASGNKFNPQQLNSLLKQILNA